MMMCRRHPGLQGGAPLLLALHLQLLMMVIPRELQHCRKTLLRRHPSSNGNNLVHILYELLLVSKDLRGEGVFV